jgi:hypothetical protein
MLNEILAKIFDSFKAKSPKLAAIILLFLGSLVYWSENGLPELIGVDLSQAVQWISFVLAALQGSRTTQILKSK